MKAKRGRKQGQNSGTGKSRTDEPGVQGSPADGRSELAVSPPAPGRAAAMIEAGRLRVGVGALAGAGAVDGVIHLVSAVGELDPDGLYSPDGVDRLVAALLRRNGTAALRYRAESGLGLPAYIPELPESGVLRFSDPRLFPEFLAGRLGGNGHTVDVLGPRRRPMEVSEVNAREISLEAAAGQLWVCRAEWRTGDRGAAAGSPEGQAVRIGWLVRERERVGDGTSRKLERSGKPGKPGKDLVRSLYQFQTALQGLGFQECRVGITRQETSRIDESRTLVRLAGDAWEAFWPLQTVAKVRDAVSSPLRTAEATVLNLELEQRGLLSLVYRLPHTQEERNAGYAVRTIHALIRRGGRGLQSFVDSAYRSGDQFWAFSVVYHALGQVEQRRIDSFLGPRREQMVERDLSGPGLGRTMVPWQQAAVAAEMLIGEYARRTHRPGYAVDADSMKILDRYYIRPRGTALKSLWESKRRDGEVEELLEHGLLSLLRSYGRRLPRAVLVEGAAGSSERTKHRLSLIYSRAGRKIFLEDVEALEGAIRRNDEVQWERLLGAQQTLKGLARRIQ